MNRGRLLLILAAGLLLRVLYLNQVAALPFYDQPIGDSAVYLQRASEILAGSFVPGRPFFYGSVLYPYLLAAVLALPGGSLYLVGLLQALAGTLLVYLLARVAKVLYGDAAGLTAAALAALYGPFAFLEADILGVTWGLLAIGSGIAWCARWGRAGEGRSLRYPLLAGFAFGLAAVERPNLMILAPLTALWAAWPPRGSSGAIASSLKPAIAVLAGAAVAFSPVILLNRAASGRWAVLNTSKGINLYIGNNPRADGTFDEPWSRDDPQFTARYTDLEESSRRMASRLAGRDLGPEEASSFWSGKAGEFIHENPAAFLRLTARKAALLWNAAEVPNHLDFSFMKQAAWALRAMPVGFGAISTLAATGIGLCLLRRDRARETILLVMVSMGSAASVLPFFVADRFRAAMVPPLIVAAASGVVALSRAAFRQAERHDWRLGASLLPALALGILSQLPLSRPDFSRDHWLLAQGYRSHGDLPHARGEYEAALKEGGEDGVLLNNLARVDAAMGLKAEAEQALRRSIQADPALAYPHKNLGLLLISRGAGEEALREIEASVSLDEEDPEALGALAALHAERGDRDAAAAAYAKARRLDPSDPRLTRLLEIYPYLGGDGAISVPATPSRSGRRGAPRRW